MLISRYKMSNKNNSLEIIDKNIDLSDIYLVNEDQYQKKLIQDNKAIFQIIDIQSNKVMREIVIEKN